MDATSTRIQAHSSLLGKVSVLVAIYMAVAAVGSFVGIGITNGWAFLGLFLVAVACIIGMRFWVTNLKVSVPLALGLAFVLGLLASSSLQTQIADLGWQPVALSFIGSSVAMFGFGAYGFLSHRDYRNWGMGLFYALIGLIILGVALSVLGAGAFAHTAYSLLGLLIFSGYFIYDFNQLRRTENTWEDAVSSSVSIFLDFVNFFEDMLDLFK